MSTKGAAKSSQPLNNASGDSVANKTPVKLTVPPFSVTDPSLWFTILEAEFDKHGIREDYQKFWRLVVRLPMDLRPQVFDFLVYPPPTGKYRTLKEAVLKVLGSQIPHWQVNEPRLCKADEFVVPTFEEIQQMPLAPCFQASITTAAGAPLAELTNEVDSVVEQMPPPLVCTVVCPVFVRPLRHTVHYCKKFEECVYITHTCDYKTFFEVHHLTTGLTCASRAIKSPPKCLYADDLLPPARRPATISENGITLSTDPDEYRAFYNLQTIGGASNRLSANHLPMVADFYQLFLLERSVTIRFPNRLESRVDKSSKPGFQCTSSHRPVISACFMRLAMTRNILLVVIDFLVIMGSFLSRNVKRKFVRRRRRRRPPDKFHIDHSRFEHVTVSCSFCLT